MPDFYVVRLGKDSVPDIEHINSLHEAPEAPFNLEVVCKQVPTEFGAGAYALMWLGSDNDKGGETEWKKGLRAFARVVSKEGGPNYKDEHTITLAVTIVFPESIDKKDLLEKAPAAYYWFSELPIVGLSSFSNQTVQHIDVDRPLEDVRALFYAIEAVHPGFKASVAQLHPELLGLFNYTPPSPSTGMPTPDGASEMPSSSSDEASTDAPTHLPAEWILALASKGFVLISGPSGTGKSRTARDIARALDYSLPSNFAATAVECRPANSLAFVSVGADWTDETPLIGFRNFFGKTTQDGGHEAWEPPAALRLLLRAVQYPEQPHFLVLDEMNLSHVERYFSQFLSLLESNRGLGSSAKLALLDSQAVQLIAKTIVASEHPLEATVASMLSEKKSSLSIPDNVFIIGTVNVDETTYMFSPKVLDRAHVLEMQAPDPVAYLSGAGEQAPDLITKELASNLLTRAAQRRRNGFWEREKPFVILKEAAVAGPFGEEITQILKDIKLVLGGIQKLLEPVGFGFAYRTTNEVCAYMATYLECGQPTLFAGGSTSSGARSALDRAVVQKVLPKIHGNRRQLGEALRALQDFLLGACAEYQLGFSKVQVPDEEKTAFPLPISARKIRNMRTRLEATGHTTFVV